jgi:sigma-B regulation protein RsbU (phosphoserine phosphatase)
VRGSARIDPVSHAGEPTRPAIGVTPGPIDPLARWRWGAPVALVLAALAAAYDVVGPHAVGVGLSAALTLLVIAFALARAGRVRDASEGTARRLASAVSVDREAQTVERATLRTSAALDQSERRRVQGLLHLADDELALAGRVHHSLLPADVEHPQVSIAVRQIPCSIVGGDYLHVAFPRLDLLYLCVGDVSGHGVAASLVVSRIHGFIQRWIFEQRTPEEIVRLLDGAVKEILEHSAFFMTFAVFRVDLAASTIDYATAGHPDQWLLRADRREVERLSTGNGLLGTRDARILGDVRTSRATFGPDDALILFTDGLFEVLPKGAGEMLGEDGLFRGISTMTAVRASSLADEIIGMVKAFGRVGAFQDDVSLLVAKFGPVVSASRTPPSSSGPS